MVQRVQDSPSHACFSRTFGQQSIMYVVRRKMYVFGKFELKSEKDTKKQMGQIAEYGGKYAKRSYLFLLCAKNTPIS